MANQLGMAEQHSIIALWKRGWSHRRIARTLGIHRETMSRYVRLASEATVRATGPPGVSPVIESDGRDAARPAKPASRVDESKPAISIAGFAQGGSANSGRQSLCEPYRKVIEAFLEQGLTAQRIWQDLQTDHGFADGYQSVQRFVRKLRSRTPLPLPQNGVRP